MSNVNCAESFAGLTAATESSFVADSAVEAEDAESTACAETKQRQKNNAMFLLRNALKNVLNCVILGFPVFPGKKVSDSPPKILKRSTKNESGWFFVSANVIFDESENVLLVLFGLRGF